jgi:mutator protein MutT
LGPDDPGSNPGSPIFDFKMEHRKVSIILFYDDEGNVLLQDRKNKSRFGEEFGFFGGAIEKGETPEQALIREVKEELGIELKKFQFFKKYYKELKNINKSADLHLFLAPMPDLNKVNVQEGKKFLTTINDAINLNILTWDKDVLKEVQKYIKNKNPE